MNEDQANADPLRPDTVEVPMGIQLLGPDFNTDAQLLIGLGAVVRASSQLEFGLRTLFCSLEGSKYAAVTAAGEQVNWVVQRSESILKCRGDISDEHRETLGTLLSSVKLAMQDRNRYVHDVWTGGIDGPQLMRSQRGSHDLKFREVSLTGLIETSRALTECVVGLTNWIAAALGADNLALEAQLRWEDHLRSLSPDELAALAERRLEG